MAEYDAVIVGSGFGGSVTAYRLASAGMKVLVLERGKLYKPGKFARNPGQMRQNLWDPSEGKLGLINFWTFDGIDAVVSAGLGGGSLIYANVLMRKNPKWFVKEDLANGGYERWPISRDDLEEHYDEVVEVMLAQRYPGTGEYAEVPKYRAFADAAKALGLNHAHPKLAVAFANQGAEPRPGEPLKDPEGYNHDGWLRQTCRLCAECVIGCNYGAKQTLDFTYLSLARKAGAEIRTLHEVRTIRRENKTWFARYVKHDTPGVPSSALQVKEVSARYLIMAAGALGSTFLMLRSRRENPGAFHGTSDRLGTAFSGNGDVLTFVLGDGDGAAFDPTYGPTITSALEVPDELEGTGAHGRGFYVEDAGYPDFLAWVVESMPRPSVIGRALRFLWRYLARSGDPNLGAELSAAIGDAALSYRSMPLLSMGRDVPDGTMNLDGDGKLEVHWHLERSADYLDRVRSVSAKIAEVLGCDVGENPLQFLRRLITVHPLGGCPMGDDPKSGFVDPYGEVYGAENLYVVDGAAMPGPVGANPALTIAAFAERCARRLIEQHPGGGS